MFISRKEKEELESRIKKLEEEQEVQVNVVSAGGLGFYDKLSINECVKQICESLKLKMRIE